MLLYINWDGFSRHWYEMARSRGAGTPNLDRMIAQGASLENHFCGLPAITNPMQQTLVSGAWPAKTGNCYVRFDRAARRFCPTLRLNRCENIVEAAQRHALRCASVHGWYFENRGCREDDPDAPYLQGDLPNFESRVALLLAYLRGEPCGKNGLVMRQKPDFAALYADDIDSVCHNGPRLPYRELRRAQTLEEWYANLVYAVQRMDRALAPLLAQKDLTIALAADHGGMPYGTAAFQVSSQEASLPRAQEVLDAMQKIGVRPFVPTRADEAVPEDAEAALLFMETQALFYLLRPDADGVLERVQKAVSALPFLRGCLNSAQQQAYGAPSDFCDLYLLTRSPYVFNTWHNDGFVGGSHAAMEDSVLHVFCAFWGPGIRKGVRVTRRTDLTSFAPTLCKMMGFDGPKDRTGSALDDIIDEGK